MRMKTVAYVIRPAEGGMLRHLIDLIRNLDRNIYSPVVLSPPGNELTIPLRSVGAEIIEIDMAGNPDLARDMGSVKRIATALTALSPDIVHAHSSKAGLLTHLAVKRSRVNAKTVFSVHNYPSYMNQDSLRRTVSSMAMRGVLEGAAAVIAVSGDIKKYLVESENAEAGKIDVIYNGIDIESFAGYAKKTQGMALRERLGIAKKAPVIGAAGRFVPAKGFDVLLNAVPALAGKMPGLKVVIAGSGPLEQKLKQQAASLGVLQTVLFTGRVEDLRPYYAMSDVFVVPSRSEPFGLIVLEVMALGRPLVATRAGGIPEIVNNRETGLLVTPEDIGQLALAIKSQFMDRKNAAAMAAEALRVVQEKFSIAQTAALTQEVYAKVSPHETVRD
jgi:glycosyltransferase involved in cell wall biosynthesis